MATTKNGTIIDSLALKRLRLRQFLTMAELGRKAGLAQSTIKALETEGRAVKVNTLKLTLEALGLTAAEARSRGIFRLRAKEDKVDWAEANGFDGRTKAHMAAFLGKLPPGFDRWDIKDEDGWTVAHEVAYYHRLPKGFRRWDLADKDGLTVAHLAAQKGALPTGFKRWELADKSGWSVAHAAAAAGKLPEDFDQWDIEDNKGYTVKDAFQQWEKQNETDQVRGTPWRS
ncbi:MAG: helix-turn-helix domain-containing protein [Deltaproteobacteria bacterium]|jgi:transcriptional regulator with XRE-family HTH domain|nr:helix-turn-helix domain-containing protein [Deltaproteobacteria bacterium]